MGAEFPSSKSYFSQKKWCRVGQKTSLAQLPPFGVSTPLSKYTFSTLSARSYSFHGYCKESPLTGWLRTAQLNSEYITGCQSFELEISTQHVFMSLGRRYSSCLLTVSLLRFCVQINPNVIIVTWPSLHCELLGVFPIKMIMFTLKMHKKYSRWSHSKINLVKSSMIYKQGNNIGSKSFTCMPSLREDV